MVVDLLCSGSKGNACLVRSAGTSILIDCGPSSKRYLLQSLSQAGASIESLDALLITHSHSDHIRQLHLFGGIPVYSCCALQARSPKGAEVALDLHPVQPPVRFQIGGLKILAVPTSHDSGPSMGFVISDEQQTLVYLTDTGYLPVNLYPILRDADYYIFESNHDLALLNQSRRPLWVRQRIASDTGHLCNQDASRLLCHLITRRTRHVVLAHLSEEANTPALAVETLKKRLDEAGMDRSSLIIEAAAQWKTVHLEDPQAELFQGVRPAPSDGTDGSGTAVSDERPGAMV